MSSPIVHDTSAVVLLNPKTPYNVGAVIRACSIFAVPTLRWTGERIGEAESRRKAGSTAHRDRLPREERMKDYSHVDWRWSPSERCVSGLARSRELTPVAVEVSDSAESLDEFVHPEMALYVFGPEDGSIPKAVRVVCHRFVHIPSETRTPFNLAAAVNIVLYDRYVKAQGRRPFSTQSAENSSARV